MAKTVKPGRFPSQIWKKMAPLCRAFNCKARSLLIRRRPRKMIIRIHWHIWKTPRRRIRDHPNEKCTTKKCPSQSIHSSIRKSMRCSSRQGQGRAVQIIRIYRRSSCRINNSTIMKMSPSSSISQQLGRKVIIIRSKSSPF